MVEEAKQAYARLRSVGVPREDARYVLPGGVVSEIVLSANLREWRHVFAVRCHPRAHWEIRRVCLDMLRILKREAPIVFQDFTVDEDRCMASFESGTGEEVLAAAGTTDGKTG
jgi:thymidylate synthase (FAD)